MSDILKSLPGQPTLEELFKKPPIAIIGEDGKQIAPGMTEQERLAIIAIQRESRTQFVLNSTAKKTKKTKKAENLQANLAVLQNINLLKPNPKQ